MTAEKKDYTSTSIKPGTSTALIARLEALGDRYAIKVEEYISAQKLIDMWIMAVIEEVIDVGDHFTIDSYSIEEGADNELNLDGYFSYLDDLLPYDSRTVEDLPGW